ncbi:MTH538 TIR-like domain [Vreelandella aquamarina]|uniref:MTH538 TIR-like domain n=2 Tax=Vreelandella aquamarina TaxID=77097 RepID=A0A1N6CSF8_9GAMM|nr:MTH538 TIR-like domain [Halomonas meridiana]SIN66564.1 MTH538 TIR-like domain [Halomonas meridiana]SIN98277.1 MTH538 TIR-like domain [Halomonas meridiana]
MAVVRRKCFISYHHADQREVDQFIRDFDHEADTFIARGLGNEMPGEVVQSSNTDYVMRRIRELYLDNSTVTLLMLGRCTWARRYVDWELQASLRQGETTSANGLLGIKLPSYPDQGGCFPKRFNDNLCGEGQADCYARHIRYPTSTQSLVDAIEAAFERRQTHAQLIVNPRGRMHNNRQC